MREGDRVWVVYVPDYGDLILPATVTEVLFGGKAVRVAYDDGRPEGFKVVCGLGRTVHATEESARAELPAMWRRWRGGEPLIRGGRPGS
jgi:hypothetical protein